MLFLFSLVSCSSNTLSGRFVNENNATEYFEFSGRRDVSLRSGDQFTSGSYSISGNTLTLTLNMGGFHSNEYFMMNSSRDVITSRGMRFIYEGRAAGSTEQNDSSGLPWWAWAAIIIVGLCLLGSKKG